jgi:hypothetical protein
MSGEEAVSRRGDAQRIGEICHEVLESLVHDGLLQSGSWQDELEQRFAELLARHEGETGGRLRGERLAVARLRKVAGRMAAFLEGVPPDAQILTEAALVAAGGRLFGRVDLIVRSADAHVIVDYKTGAFLETGTHRLKESYERQLMLYACLEAEASGTWPDQALLVPLGAEPVSLEIDPAACERLLQDVIEALERWEAWVGAAPPANPSPEACGWCPFAARCVAFWAACAPDWKDTLLATRGRVLSSATTPLGGTTLRIESREGSVIGTFAIRNVDPPGSFQHWQQSQRGETWESWDCDAIQQRASSRCGPVRDPPRPDSYDDGIRRGAGPSPRNRARARSAGPN